MKMPVPPGSNNDELQLAGDIVEGDNINGIYAKYPAATPKYQTSNDLRDIERQARLFVAIPRSLYPKLRALVPLRSRQLLDVLCPQSQREGVGFFDFAATSISIDAQEKVQITEVLVDGYVAYYFGQRPVRMNITGELLNTRQDPWYDVFHLLYQDVLRGSESTKYELPIRLRYDNREVIGSWLNLSQSLTAQDELTPQFQGSALVQQITVMQPVYANDLSNTGIVFRPIVNLEDPTPRQVALYDSLKDAGYGNPPAADHLRDGWDMQEVSDKLNEAAGSFILENKDSVLELAEALGLTGETRENTRDAASDALTQGLRNQGAAALIPTELGGSR